MNSRRIVGGILAVITAGAFTSFCLTSRSLADPALGPFNYIKNNADGSQTLTGHVPWEVKDGTSVFVNHAVININAQVILPLSNQTKLRTLLQGLYDPKSPVFHRFLTPFQFALQFAPLAADSIQVQGALKKEGITVTGRSPNGAVLYVTGPAGAFEHAFGLHINYYQKKDGKLFFAPDADPVIPAYLAGKVLAVGGLDDLPKYQARLKRFQKALPRSIGSGPGGFLAPADVKTAYNLNLIKANGSGQTVALFELDGYNPSDIVQYLSYFKLPSSNILDPCNFSSSTPYTPIDFSDPPNTTCASNSIQNVYMDGFNGIADYINNGGGNEVTLDIELVTAFAPGSDLLVYQASNTIQSWIDEWTQIATDNKAKIISCSWGEPEEDSPTLSFDNQIFSQMAAQGQAVFVASGDNGAFDAGGRSLAVDEPASQPFVTAVGISKLTMNSDYSYNNETASVYGGGGISSYWPIPSYQTNLASQAVSAAQVSASMRNLPDLVLTADAATGYSFYINGTWSAWYGSSIAAPVWASFISLVNQGAGPNAPIGFINPTLYQLAQSGSYANDFHDISTGDNGYYPAEPGFDDASGLGSLNGLNLYNDLVKIFAPLPPVVVITSPSSSSSFTAGTNITITASASELNGTVSKVAFYNGSALLGTAASSPYSFIWDNVPAGTYSLTAVVTDSYGVSVTSSPVSITVTALAAPEIIDNTNTAKVTITGSWPASTTVSGYYGTNYLTDGNALKGTKSVTYTPSLLGGAGSYQVYIRYTAYSNRASNVPADINHAGTTTTVTVNQQINGGTWVMLGTYHFLGNASGEGLTIRTTATNGYVIADAVEFVPTATAQSLPVITAQPVSLTVTAGVTATFTVAASGTPSPAYQWQQKTSGAVNFTPISGATGAAYTTAATTTADNGTQFDCVVTNAAGSVTSNAATLTVKPQVFAPTVNITGPANNSSFSAGANITITAAASETNGAISNVTFYNGNVLLGAVTGSPYSYTWDNVPAGTYSLTAFVTDSYGVSVTSSPVSITVTALAAPEIIDNTNTAKVTITGSWPASTTVSGFYGTNYISDGNSLKGTKSVTYTPVLAGGAGMYQVYIRYTSYYNRASNVPVDINHAGATTTVTVDQQTKGGTWVLLGTFNFLGNANGEGLTVRTTATNGYVIADAVEFVQT